ncbi:MAG: sodium:calcium symporter [candidate division Zixibacteria bacterium]|nr:sodium:calcium symporter [candidate division Zixibacteria bacterium]
MPKLVRERWGTKLGVILAVSGSAVGLGNFLRFPTEAGKFGAGAFMIPYLVALIVVGIPLVWVEWTLGRYGGQFGHSSGPGIFQALRPKGRFLKYIGVMAVFGPLAIFSYYCYIESWTLGYSIFSILGKMPEVASAAEADKMAHFWLQYLGVEEGGSFTTTYILFLITFIINIVVIYFGLRGGIEKVCNFALPTLLVLGIILAVRVLTLPPGTEPSANAVNGLGYLWNQDFSKLKDPQIWLAAAGQVFFTLSVGMGVILTYSSYLRQKDDVALSGLTSATANEFAEVVLAGSIIIPAAFIFFGPNPAAVQQIADSGSFSMGFVTMPLIFQQIPGGAVFGFIWFFMLFLAGVTSSISIVQPIVAFLKNEFGLSRGEAVLLVGAFMFILCQPAIWFLKYGVMDDIDFWAANFIIVLGALIEIILFGWVLGSKKGWKELHRAANIKVPGIFRVLIKYITPLFLAGILGVWLYQNWFDVILMNTDPAGNPFNPEHKPYVLMARFFLLSLFIILCTLTYIAWRRHKGQLDLSDEFDEDQANKSEA